MICLVCILLILAAMPAAYYFFGPISIIIGSLGILYLGYKKICIENCRGDKND